MTRQIKAGLSNEVGIYQVFDPARTLAGFGRGEAQRANAVARA